MKGLVVFFGLSIVLALSVGGMSAKSVYENLSAVSAAYSAAIK